MKSANLVLGLEIHPDSFAATMISAYSNHDAERLWTHSKVDIFELEAWLTKHVPSETVLVIEAGSNSFEFADIAKSLNYSVVVLESQSVGQIKTAYLKNDVVDSEKIAKAYLSGMAKVVWQPDQQSRQRREIFLKHRNAVKDCTRARLRIRTSKHGIVECNHVLPMSWTKCVTHVLTGPNL